MLRPPLPITKTFFTSTRSRAPAITPLLRYAWALGASWVLFHFGGSWEKARSCRYTADDSWLFRRARIGREARDVKARELADGVIARYCPVKAGARRARRPQRAISGGQREHLASLGALLTPAERKSRLKGLREPCLRVDRCN